MHRADRSSQHARRRPWWGLPASVALVGVLVAGTPLNAWLSRPLVDVQLRALAPRAPLAGVVVVEIDEESIAALRPLLGAWPYKRDIYALVVEQLRAAGAQAIVLDLLLSDEREGDAALAQALRRPGAPVVLAAAGLRPLPELYAPQAAMGWSELSLPAASVWTPGLPVGLITTALDSDAQLRTVPLWHEVQGRRWPSLPLAAWRAAHPAMPGSWPEDEQGRVGIAFTADDTAVSTLPFTQLALAALQRPGAEMPVDALRDRVVFIGAGPLLGDRVATPAGLVGGTAALTQAYVALRDQRTVRAPAPWFDAALLLIVLLPAAWVGWRGRLHPLRDGSIAAGALLAVTLAAAAALIGLAQLTQPAAALLAGAAGIAFAAVAHQRKLLRSHERRRHQRELADAANRAKSQFLAQVSHEIRTPMHALLGVTELLAQSDLQPEQRRLVQLFRDAGHSLQMLLGDLLDLSKVEAGRLELQRADFALGPLLERLAALMGQRAAMKGVALELRCADDLPHSVNGDAQRLEQALTNLLANAIKFTAAGRIVLDVQRGAADLLRFAVVDSGIGIAPGKLETIFEPFAQADGSVARHYGGTGLGLTITRSVARLMGGDVTVTSTPGTGSTFTFSARLPIAAPVAAAPSSRSAVPGGLAGRHVLLAEDHDVNVMIFRAMLDGIGLTIDVAGNGQQALQMALAGAYDAVFTDLQMPALGGLAMTQALRRVEADEGRRRTPVVALTASAYAADIAGSLDAGCDLHLAKPYTQQQLLDALARITAAAPQTADSA